MTNKHWSFVEKPTGVSTHQVERDSGPSRWGLAEYLSWHRQNPHLVVHRLDKGTSGAMIFAHNPESSGRLSQAFANHQVQKSYLLVTPGTQKPVPHMAHIEAVGAEFRVRSNIERQGSQFTSTRAEKCNAETRFVQRESKFGYVLWQAQPLTGKSHQIRLHAQALGASILGDTEHGGRPFARLMLHAEKLEFLDPEIGQMHCPAPLLFSNLELLKDGELCRWIVGIERRLSLFGREKTQCLRWLHLDGGFLRADCLGAAVFFYWFAPTSPEPHILEKIKRLAELLQIPRWYLRWMQDRGSGVRDLPVWLSHSENPQTWTAQENELKFEFQAQSLSPGLFLDQRSNRRWVQKTASGKKVLNLFCYTGGFSVAAARGGASLVVSVDLSANFLRWLHRNLELNDLSQVPLENHAQDCRRFLDIAAKKNRLFDLIICDPPSFSRSSLGLFRIDKDLGVLIQKMHKVLSRQGTILFSTNFEKWSFEDFLSAVRLVAAPLKLHVEAAEPPEWDFELPGEIPVMKSVRLRHQAEPGARSR